MKAGEVMVDRLRYAGSCPPRVASVRAPERFALYAGVFCTKLTDSARLCHVPERHEWVLQPTGRPPIEALGL